MNDCFWCFIEGVCKCDSCHDCQDYLSANSDEGFALLEKYQADVDEALKPVSEKWAKIKEQRND